MFKPKKPEVMESAIPMAKKPRDTKPHLKMQKVKVAGKSAFPPAPQAFGPAPDQSGGSPQPAFGPDAQAAGAAPGDVGQ